MTQTLDMLMMTTAWHLAWISALVAVALFALSGSGEGDAEDAGDGD